MKNLFKSLFYILIPLLLGGAISFIYKDSFSFIDNLNRTIKVPSIFFIIAWTILYLLSGVFYYFIEKNNESINIRRLYWISLFINLIFVPILFGLNNLVLSFIDVLVLLLIITYLFIKLLVKKKKYSYLLTPYIIWLIIALSLSLDLLINN